MLGHMAVRAVVDTNVLVAGLRSRRGASFRLLSLLADNRWQPCLSVAVSLEYEEVLKRQFMAASISPIRVDELLDYLFTLAVLVEVPFRLRPALRDPSDDRILELAAHADATIVTFNTRDFAGSEIFGVQVLTPKTFLQRIGERF
jgi:putative PIN family toxin of toxin-antitoxin system